MSPHRNDHQENRFRANNELARFISRFWRSERGAAAVEMGLLTFPFLLLIFGILQVYAFRLTQNTLSDALFASASNPELALLSGNKDAYKSIVCGKSMFPTACNSNLKLELQPLQNAPTAKTEITGTTFNAGSSNDVLLLRASTDGVQFVPFIPFMTAKASVIFRRPI